MRPHDPVESQIERLLGVKLSLLGPVRRNPHHRRDGGCERSGLGDLPAIEHVLQAVPQRPDVPRIMLHLEDNAVVLGGAHGDGGLGISLAKRGERRLARFQRADDAIEAWNIGHALCPSMWVGYGRPQAAVLAHNRAACNIAVRARRWRKRWK